MKGLASETSSTDNCIAYTNRTCKMVSKKAREMKNIKGEYVVGEGLVCRKYMKVKNQKLNVNYKYEVVEVKDDALTLKHTATDKTITLNIDLVRKNFIYAYCYTAHSKQGCSVDGDVVIYDWNYRYADKNWFFTAITRARDFNKVKFYYYEEDEDDLEKMLEAEYFNNKINSYKQQDFIAGRETESEEYIDIRF